jgi:hypothetical protein
MASLFNREGFGEKGHDTAKPKARVDWAGLDTFYRRGTFDDDRQQHQRLDSSRHSAACQLDDDAYRFGSPRCPRWLSQAQNDSAARRGSGDPVGLITATRRPDNARSFAALKLQVAAVQRSFFDLNLVDFTTARVPAQPV